MDKGQSHEGCVLLENVVLASIINNMKIILKRKSYTHDTLQVLLHMKYVLDVEMISKC